MQRRLFLLTIVLSVSYMACKKTVGDSSPVSQTDCNGVDSRFSTKVFPVIQGSCATSVGCHGNGSTNGPGALTGFAQISNCRNCYKERRAFRINS